MENVTQPHEVTHALVLAAGQGSRLNSRTPKPLYPVLGLPLLARTLFTLERAGITDAYVVLGYEGDRIRRAIERLPRLGLRVHWLYNQSWQRPNGRSVLAAREVLDRPFILTMSDHVFEPGIVTGLRNRANGQRGVWLAVDHNVAGILDLVDATKVRDGSGTIDDIGKSIEDFNAVDTGVFLATPELFEAIAEECQAGRETLTDGVRRLAQRGTVYTNDVTGMLWQDVDTPRDARAAERKLLASARKPTDGPIARRLNRPMSLALSRYLLKLRVRPNVVTLLHLLLGLGAALAAAQGGYLPFLASGVLFQLASVVDGSDGEIAKLTFRSSPAGEWFDTVADSVTYVAWLTGLTIGVRRAGWPDMFFFSGLASFALATAAVTSLYVFLARRRLSGSLLAVEYRFWNRQDRLSRFIKLGEPLLRRDAFTFLFMVLAVVGLLPLALPLAATGALFAFGLSIEANLALGGVRWPWSRLKRRARRINWSGGAEAQPVPQPVEPLETS